MNTTTSDLLTGAARAVTQAEETALLVIPHVRRQDFAAVEAAAIESARFAADARERLRVAGVALPADDLPVSRPLDLSELDTPDVRTLLDGVRALVPLAERIDQARGRWYPEAPTTDTKGTDLAEQLHLIACRLSLEVHGPSTGRD